MSDAEQRLSARMTAMMDRLQHIIALVHELADSLEARHRELAVRVTRLEQARAYWLRQ
jgi:hypothetical protein